MTGRGLRGRHQARVMLFIAVALDTFSASMFLLAPTYGGPMRVGPPSPVAFLVPAIGIALNAAGLIWMAWLYPRDAEAHPSWWRFDRF